MVPYLIQYAFPTAVSLILLYGVFLFFLRRETFFSSNRLFLLFAILFSSVLPFIPVPASSFEPVYNFSLEEFTTAATETDISPLKSLTFWQVTGFIYLAGCLIFTLKLLLGLVSIIYLMIQNGVTEYKGSKVVFLSKNGRIPHFSFFNLTFLNVQRIDNKIDEAAIFTHEREHKRRLHCVDLILLEIITIVQWFNPIVWLYNRSLKSIHEYEADQAVIKSGYQKTEYVNLIFHQISGFPLSSFVNKFNFSNLKKRIIMINKKKSPGLAKSKLLLAFPVAAWLLFCFGTDSLYSTEHTPFPGEHSTMAPDSIIKKSEQQPAALKSAEKAQKESSEEVVFTAEDMRDEEVYSIVEQEPSFPGGDEARLKFLQEHIQYPAEAKEKGKQGTVYVGFIVEKDGTISTIKIVRGVDESLDKECIRVTSLMPKWIPGTQKGKAVRVSYRMPIRFTLALENETEKK